jgi:hypothetical protein
MMSLCSRRELVASIACRYLAADKAAKGRILDEFVGSTGLHRKYAIRALRRSALGKIALAVPLTSRRRRGRHYGNDVEQPFLALWRISGGICPKRLMPFLAELIERLEAFDEISLCPHVRTKLLSMSIATAERMLSRALRSHERGINTSLPSTLLRKQIPIRTFEDWNESPPGVMQIDLVAHCGGTAAGDYAYTLTMTDVCTGWTECVAVANRGQAAVQAGVDKVRRVLPFPLIGVHSDNGGEFINHLLKRYWDDLGIKPTRGRPYKKNDQCHVEQKNGAIVRLLVGYGRYEGTAAVSHLNRLYDKFRLAANFFGPSMKLISKTRVGASVKKTYDEAKTPWKRLCNFPEHIHRPDRLTQEYEALNPAQVRREITDLEMQLRRFTVADPTIATPSLIGQCVKGGQNNG